MFLMYLVCMLVCASLGFMENIPREVELVAYSPKNQVQPLS